MRSGRLSVFMVFALNGVVIGSWAPRMPALAEQIGATAGVLGLALLGASIGMIAAASLTGRLCARFGARVMVLVSALATAVVLPVLASVGSPLQLGLVLVLLGASVGMLDVAMNVAAVTVIRRTERPLMPVFHAGFSFGALAGSMGAAFAAGHGLGLVPHFSLVAGATVLLVAGTITFVPREEAAADTGEHTGPDRRMLRRPVLWLLGLIALFSAIVEGASGDWSALFGVRERGMSEAAGAVTFSVFCVAMGIVRLLGEQIERRFGAVKVLVTGSLMAGFGLIMIAAVPSAWLAYVGFAMAGGGLAFAFPVALDLAGAVGRRGDGTGGEREIGFVTTIAYSGFLIGPPMIGGVAQVTNLEFAIGFAGVIALLIAPAAIASARARRRESEAAGREKETIAPATL
ncbi:MFS transporter [Actinophytocola algeriensis]|uniref:MFS family permease n=1 Tax=Actinophytocola algeriensis TaxID=1768010 RepID=A0A7W7VBZ9_9PSEU|nr:MFS transporter [Actinophytocola algeriensis]MBB4904574.1 MFS family permease [Actinophytocola algeriensis]MBE1476567.1 MFS family permease [Actinophytocola algeriensis]